MPQRKMNRKQAIAHETLGALQGTPRLRQLRRAHPELEIEAAPRELRIRVMEINETAQAEMAELVLDALESAGLDPDFTLQVSEGVFIRPLEKAEPAVK